MTTTTTTATTAQEDTMTATTTHTTREAWLVAAVEELRPIFAAVGVELPTVRVSVGWPGGRGNKSKAIGQCWASASAADKVANLFISPVLDDAVRVLDVLAHELVHAADDCKSGHRGTFAKVARAIGLEGPLTATVAGDALRAKLVEIAKRLGPYSHGALVNMTGGPGKQSTRMIKVMCTDEGCECEGYTVRTTRKWLDMGSPLCPYGSMMIEV